MASIPVFIDATSLFMSWSSVTFAPSILAEHAHEYLLNYCPDHVASEYMTTTYNIAHNLKERIPAVVHVDGTARPQVVHARNDPHYHRIITEYYRLSGIPLIINTSYNIHEEPMKSFYFFNLVVG